MSSETPGLILTMARDLADLGIEPGDCLMAHSSFKSLGLRHAGPCDVIHTLLHVLGPGGTLMMPTFTYSYSGIWGVEPFNPARTPGVGNGILTEALRNYPGALRSAHPTYSVAAIGHHAEDITANRENASALGIGSSYDTAYHLGAKILLLGVGNDRNSMLHYAEARARLPYNDIPFREFWGRSALVDRDGTPVEVAIKQEFPACSMNFGVADSYLGELGLLRRGRVCHADSMLMSSQCVVDAVAERLRSEPSWLLCRSFACEPCTLRRMRLHEKGLL